MTAVGAVRNAARVARRRDRVRDRLRRRGAAAGGRRRGSPAPGASSRSSATRPSWSWRWRAARPRVSARRRRRPGRRRAEHRARRRRPRVRGGRLGRPRSGWPGTCCARRDRDVVGIAPAGVEVALPALELLSEKGIRGSYYGSGDAAALLASMAEMTAAGRFPDGTPSPRPAATAPPARRRARPRATAPARGTGARSSRCSSRPTRTVQCSVSAWSQYGHRPEPSGNGWRLPAVKQPASAPRSRRLGASCGQRQAVRVRAGRVRARPRGLRPPELIQQRRDTAGSDAAPQAASPVGRQGVRWRVASPAKRRRPVVRHRRGQRRPAPAGDAGLRCGARGPWGLQLAHVVPDGCGAERAANCAIRGGARQVADQR